VNFIDLNLGSWHNKIVMLNGDGLESRLASMREVHKQVVLSG